MPPTTRMTEETKSMYKKDHKKQKGGQRNAVTTRSKQAWSTREKNTKVSVADNGQCGIPNWTNQDICPVRTIECRNSEKGENARVPKRYSTYTKCHDQRQKTTGTTMNFKV